MQNTMRTYIQGFCIVWLLRSSGVHCDRPEQCYSCNGVNSISACNNTEHCTRSQTCYMEEYKADTGHFMYYGGCAELQDCRVTMHADGANYNTYSGLPGHNGVRVCAICCRKDDLCNGHLCEKSVHGPSHGDVNHHTPNNVDVRCFSCDGVHTLQECSVTELCSTGYHCYMEVYAGTDGVMRHYGGCISDLQCARTGLPTHVGEKVCGVCCNHDLCNNNLCGQQRPKNRRCLQCYDQSVEELGSCRNSVECAANDSRCSIVMREENDLVTVDMDCEENLSCSSNDAPPNQMCAVCCTTDNCNQQLDCSKKATFIPTTSSTSPPHVTTGMPVSQTYKGVECEICDGGSCGLLIGQLSTVQCPDDIAPFCVNKITNYVNGDKQVKKRCGSAHECEATWLDNSSNYNNCSNFDPSAIYTSSFQCKFCCVTPNCNRNIVPDVGTQYRGF